MKTITTIVAALLFGTLFYDQNIGLNLTIFSIITIVVLALANPGKLKLRQTLVLLSLYVVTAILVFIHHSALSILTNCALFFTLVGSFSESNSSIYIKWLNGIYSSIAGIFHRNFESQNNEEKSNGGKKIDVAHTAKLVIIPLVVIILFIFLYKNGNPVFESFIAKINFDFVNFQWILFCLMGYYLFTNIIVPVKVQPATEKDLITENKLHPKGELNIENLLKEKQLGTLLLALLNVLIVLYILSDIAFLVSNDNFAASVLSNQVHNGINALIASIIFAILIILYFFRGNFNFFDENKNLKNLSYSWIFLNAFLVLLIIIKNTQYIDSFGLTYKRIGVYIYIFMTLVGLITTFLKVFKVQNLWFLFRKNVSVAFILLILCSTINWDARITEYNIENADSLDVNYLINLSNNNAFILYENRSRMVLKPKQEQRIASKYTDYKKRLSENSWQEYTYDNFKFNQKIASHEGTE